MELNLYFYLIYLNLFKFHNVWINLIWFKQIPGKKKNVTVALGRNWPAQNGNRGAAPLHCVADGGDGRSMTCQWRGGGGSQQGAPQRGLEIVLRDGEKRGSPEGPPTATWFGRRKVATGAASDGWWWWLECRRGTGRRRRHHGGAG
jgi:hypothetical protein